MPFIPYYMAVENLDGSMYDCIVYDLDHFLPLFQHDAARIWVSEYTYPDPEDEPPYWVRSENPGGI